MKKLILLLSTLLSFGLFSCEDVNSDRKYIQRIVNSSDYDIIIRSFDTQTDIKLLADFAEANNIEEEFEKTGEIPKAFTDFQSETFLKYYGKDFSDNSTERTEGVGSMHDDCYWTGRTGYVYGPISVFWELDEKVSSYQIVFVSWLAFHDKRFFRGKSLWL
jgi:hypothetical protein